MTDHEIKNNITILSVPGEHTKSIRDQGQSMAYRELIKSLDKFRSYMRDCYQSERETSDFNPEMYANTLFSRSLLDYWQKVWIFSNLLRNATGIRNQ